MAYQVYTSPSLVRSGIYHPQLRKRVIPTALRPINSLVLPTQEIKWRGKQVGNVCLGVGCHVREEAVVQEAAFKDEVAQRVGEVPDEEEAERAGC